MVSLPADQCVRQEKRLADMVPQARRSHRLTICGRRGLEVLRPAGDSPAISLKGDSPFPVPFLTKLGIQ